MAVYAHLLVRCTVLYHVAIILLPEMIARVGNSLRDRSAHCKRAVGLSESIPSALYRGAVGASLRGPKLWALAPSNLWRVVRCVVGGLRIVLPKKKCLGGTHAGGSAAASVQWVRMCEAEAWRAAARVGGQL